MNLSRELIDNKYHDKQTKTNTEIWNDGLKHNLAFLLCNINTEQRFHFIPTVAMAVISNMSHIFSQ